MSAADDLALGEFEQSRQVGRVVLREREAHADLHAAVAAPEQRNRDGANPLRQLLCLAAARDDMRSKGATVLGTGEPRIGAHGTPVIFVHPKNMGGVLVELMETPKEAH